MTHHEPLSTAKALIAFLVLVLAVILFLLFMMYGENMAINGQLTTFKILAIIEGALLLTLLYFANNTQHPHVAKSSSKKAKSKSRSKKK